MYEAYSIEKTLQYVRRKQNIYQHFRIIFVKLFHALKNKEIIY